MAARIGEADSSAFYEIHKYMIGRKIQKISEENGQLKVVADFTKGRGEIVKTKAFFYNMVNFFDDATLWTKIKADLLEESQTIMVRLWGEKTNKSNLSRLKTAANEYSESIEHFDMEMDDEIWRIDETGGKRVL